MISVAEGRLKGRWFWLLGLVFLVTVACMVVPFAPLMPLGGRDPSWVFGMNEAVARGLVFGRDMVFTFGPYTAVYTHTFHPSTDGMALMGGAHLAICMWLAILLLIHQVRWYWAILFLGAFFLLGYSRDAILFAYPVLVVTVFRETLASMSSGERIHMPLLALLALLLTPLGLLPLIKGSLLIICILAVLATVWMLMLWGDWRMVQATFLLPLCSMLIYWSASGQPLGAMPDYFLSMAPIISGYTDAMSREGFLHELLLYASGALLLLLAVHKQEKSLLSGWFLLLGAALFLVFKAGYVRHDNHALTAATFLFFAAVLVAMLSSRFSVGRVQVLAALMLGGVLLASSVAIYSINTATIKSMLVSSAQEKGMEAKAFNFLPRGQQARMALELIGPAKLARLVWDSVYMPWPFTSALNGLRLRAQGREALETLYARQLASLRREMPIPDLSGSVDIYSVNQSALIASGNKWHPRPVFQSYSTYTPTLLLRNLDHLTHQDAPTHILFNVEPIDKRVPSLEDGVSWLALLQRYQPVALGPNWLHLTQRAVQPRSELPRVAGPVRTVGLGERVSVSPSAAPLFATIRFKPTLLGRLINVVHRPAALYASFQLADGTTRRYRIVSGMTQTAFLLSPLVESTAEFALLYGADADLAGKRVVSFQIDSAGSVQHWQPTYELTFLERPPVPRVDITPLLNAQTLQMASKTAVPSKLADQCAAHVESIGGVSPDADKTLVHGLLSIRFWMVPPASSGPQSGQVLAVLRDAAGNVHGIHAQQLPDPEGNAGSSKLFGALADVRALQGQHVLELAYQDGKVLKRCPEISIPLTIQ